MCSSGGSLDTSANSHPNLSFMNSSFFDHEQVDDHLTDMKREEVCETSGGLGFPEFPTPVSPFFSVPDGLSPANFLDSPFFLSNSNLPPSPNEAFPAHLFDSTDKQENHDFPFETQTNPCTISSSEAIFASSMTMGETYVGRQQAYMHEGFAAHSIYSQPTQTVRVQKQTEDGYNWRKYGQKQVKGSENPRSYYKCSFANCPTKKKVETSFEGKVTEIIYKGTHNHPKPQFTRRSPAIIPPSVTVPSSQVPEHFVNTQMVSFVAPENSSSSNGEDDFDSFQRKRSGGDEFDEYEQPEAKKWKQENENEGISSGSRSVREPKVIVQTTSDIDILDDGYRWRKYGQKVVKGNPNPRSYYKCTNTECPVRKHVERASHDMKAVITTYEGKHNHEIPAARGSGYHSVNTSLPDNNMNSIVVPIRPLAKSNYINNITGSTLPAPQGQAHFTIELLQNRLGGYQFPECNSSIIDSLINPLQTDSNVFSVRKEEPREDIFFESLLF